MENPLSTGTALEDRWTKRLALSYDAHTHPVLASPRVMLACYNRCYCPYPLDEDTGVQPRADKETQDDVVLVSRLPASSYEIKVDVMDDFDTPINQHVGHRNPGQSLQPVPALLVIALNQIHFALRDFHRQDTNPAVVGPPHNLWISMYPENSITCWLVYFSVVLQNSNIIISATAPLLKQN